MDTHHCLVALLAIVSTCSAQLIARPVTYAAAPTIAATPAVFAPARPVVAAPVYDTYDPHPSYHFSYSVNDPLTGDNHGHSETRDGDVVRGSYFLVEPDGSVRTVDYTADDINGFVANVHNDAATSHPVSRPPVAIASSPVAIAPAPIAVAQVPVATIARPVTVPTQYTFRPSYLEG